MNQRPSRCCNDSVSPLVSSQVCLRSPSSHIAKFGGITACPRRPPVPASSTATRDQSHCHSHLRPQVLVMSQCAIQRCCEELMHLSNRLLFPRSPRNIHPTPLVLPLSFSPPPHAVTKLPSSPPPTPYSFASRPPLVETHAPSSLSPPQAHRSGAASDRPGVDDPSDLSERLSELELGFRSRSFAGTSTTPREGCRCRGCRCRWL